MRTKFGFLTPAGTQLRRTKVQSVIAPNDDVGVAAALVGAAVVGRRLSDVPIFTHLGGPVTAMALSFGASSLNILPESARATNNLRDIAVTMATPCLLLEADVAELRKSAGPLLGAFIVAAIGTTLAATVAWFVTKRWLSVLGSDAVKVAAALAAKNIGGGVNFAAVSAALGASPSSQAAALCADNVMALVYFPLCAILAGSTSPVPKDSSFLEEKLKDPVTPKTLLEAAWTALLLLAAADRIGPRLPMATLLALAVAAIAPSKFKRSVAPAATCAADALLYVFFASAGAAGGSARGLLRSSGPPLLAFLTILYLGHTLVLLTGLSLIARSPKAPPPAELRSRFAVASNAAIGGPATAAALCTSKNWATTIPPALCIGTVGYAIASFIGLALASFVFR